MSRITTPIEEAIADIISSLKRSIADQRSETVDAADLLAVLHAAAPAWPAILRSEGRQPDRRSSLFSAPLFTSNSHPWPRDGVKHLEPVLQVSLQVLGTLRHECLGEGWLQVWMTDDEGLIRIVPEDAVRSEPLAPIPSGLAGDYHERLRFADRQEVPAWLEEGHSIAGFGPPFFDYPTNELLAAVDAVRESLRPRSDLDRKLSRLQSLMEIGGVDGMPSRYVHRAFGSVNESDMSATDVPSVLFVLEDRGPLRESANGDDGVYVCYELEGGAGPRFSVHGRGLSS